MIDKYAIDLTDSQLIQDQNNEVIAYLPRYLVFLKPTRKQRLKLLDGTNNVDTIIRRYGSIPIHTVTTGDKK